MVFRENSKLWTNIHTRLTCLSVSSEEGRPTILLAHYNFWFYMRQSRLRRKIAQKCLEILPFFYSLHILPSDQRKFCFRVLFGQLFMKLRELFWKISSNLWKALIHEQGCYFAHIRDGLFFFWSGQMRNIDKNCLQGLKRPNKLFANVIG